MFTIGLTGGIGSGKSTVAQWFEKQGVPVLDADKTVHSLLQSDSLVISKIVRDFGTEILDEKGQIIRSKLGLQIFNDEDARKRLERIVHPRVVECMKAEEAVLLNSRTKVCVWDVPLLFEAGFEKFVDEVWVVWIPRDLQILRLLARDKLNLSEVEARIAAQGSLDDKRQRADVVIDNSGNHLQTVNQLEEAWKRIINQLAR
ncbi:dephospho-CoA kinase [Desulfosporosinus sp. BICA1-9]|uniref:dephospho-CoA kinase n=1 Tax=Desulfosporosinus sp. BICA1-9 TaxID=1531958 RepID=UPI00054C4D20|nr:dephospho-CoA kinase [Desulfosporosinus sp. BICA1-9]KJS48014.1 MAG: dephospho-CoA kinase [Peptococcaceae bacterium BRH_c23]KJS82024.1 MAG: dephospho-CoA kinase [Desulfosporosinus sp. BICA1-9]HBW35906.1 dephospho-CoA kinase [Desulfosporosinus sp.]